MIFNNKNGITLVALGTMIILIITLTGTLTYVSVNAIDIKKANEIKTDLMTLTNKVDEYYLRTSTLPTIGDAMKISSGDPTSTHKIGSEELPLGKLNKYDNENYYLIDYNLLDGITLNNSDRAYIINEKSHTIYVLNGYNTSVDKEYTLPYVNKVNEIEDE